MKTLTASQSLGASASRFESARALAFSLAESDTELLEPELVAWIDRATGKTSPVLDGLCWSQRMARLRRLPWRGSSGGRRRRDIVHLRRVQPFDSYEHFGPGPYINLRDAQGNESICRVGGKDCVPLDEWTSKLT